MPKKNLDLLEQGPEKFDLKLVICHYLNRVQCLQLSDNCDNENRQCEDNQCP